MDINYIKFPDDISPTSIINGSDRIIIAKASGETFTTSLSRLSKFLGDNGQQVEPVLPGELPYLDTFAEKFMQVTEEGDYYFEGELLANNPRGYITVFWWSNGVWELSSQYRVLGEKGDGVVSAVVNDDGDLIITYTDGAIVNAGRVKGEKGEKGDNLTYQDLTAEDIIDLSQSINVNAQRIPAVSAGELPTPTEPNSYMEVTAVGTWTYGGTTIGSNPIGSATTFWWDGSTWSLNDTVELPVDPLSVKREQAGFITVEGGVNIIPEINPPDYDDYEFWGIGRLRDDGTVQPSATSYRYMLDYYPITHGEYETNIWIGGANSRIILYNNSKEIISTIENPKGNQTGTIFYDVTIPEGCAYIRISVIYEADPYSRFFRPKSDILVPTSEVFATPNYVQEAKGEAINVSKENTKDVISKLGFAPIEEGTNLLEQLHTSDIEDENVWGRGFLRDNGTISGDATYYYTIQFHRVYQGNYILRTGLSGSARAIVYDQDKNIVLVIDSSGMTSANSYQKEIVLPENAYFIRISNRFEIVYKEELGLTAIEDIYISQPSVTTGEVKSVIKDTISLKHPAKRRHPIVTFISDDGNRNELNWYIPILRSKGVLSTLAIVTSRMLAPNSGWLFKEEVVELYKEGFDIASHTHTHFNLGDGDRTLEEMDEDIAKGRLILNSLGIDCPMFVAPSGARNPTIDAIIRRYHKADFITSVSSRQLPYANIPPIHSMSLNRVSFDAGENGLSTLTQCKDAVDEAIDFGGWVIFTVHPNYQEYLEDTNPIGWEERRQDLRDLIDYIQGLEIPILTAKAAFDFYQNMEELGNRTDTKYYALGMDGSEDGGYFS